MVPVSENEAFRGGSSTIYRCATIFTQKPDTDHLYSVRCNATEHDVRNYEGGWRVLSFDHNPKPGTVNGTYSSVAYVGLERHLAAPAPAQWMGQLIPRDYEYAEVDDVDGTLIPPNRVFAGLTGDLALLLGLAAFSAPPNSQRAVLTTSVLPGGWHPHNFPHGRRLNFLHEVGC